MIFIQVKVRRACPGSSRERKHYPKLMAAHFKKAPAHRKKTRRNIRRSNRRQERERRGIRRTKMNQTVLFSR